MLGIVNGTTNYILTRMDESGAAFDDALAEAQALGYAEADPTADVEGHDAAAKAAIIASLAFHSRVTARRRLLRGHHRRSPPTTSRRARAMGHVIKLLAIAERSPTDAGISVRVHPAMVPRTHPLASVREAYNAVFVECRRGRPADVLRPGRRWRADGQRRARRHRRGRAQPASAAARGPRESAYADAAGAARRRGDDALLHLRSTSPTRPACWQPVAADVRRARRQHRDVRQDGHGDDADLADRHARRAREAALAATCEALRGLDVGPRSRIV